MPFYIRTPTPTPASKIRGLFLRHRTGSDVAFLWKDDPKFSDDWERIAAVPDTGAQAVLQSLMDDAGLVALMRPDQVRRARQALNLAKDPE